MEETQVGLVKQYSAVKSVTGAADAGRIFGTLLDRLSD